MSAAPSLLPADGPYLVPPFTGGTSGVDFLGLRQVNLELTAACFPGINNVTRFVRPFSVLAWIHWKFSQQAEAAGRKNVSDHDLRIFQEKVEVLFTWGHQLHPSADVRIPGISAGAPAAGPGGWVDLTFAAWKRVPRNTSLQAPVQYGPAMKVGSGLGFLESRGRGLSAFTHTGAALAQGLDQRLRKTEAYDLVSSLDRNKAHAADADALLRAWHAARPNADEARVFSAAFYQPDSAGASGSLGQRSAMIAAIFATLRSARGSLNEDEIRRSLVWQRLPNGRALDFSAPCAVAVRRWKVLQMRQMQRVALESLLQWFEHCLDDGEHRLETIQQQLAAAFADDARSDGGKATCAQVLKRFAKTFDSEADYRSQCAQGHDDDLLRRGQALFDSDELDTVPVEAAWILIGLVQWTLWLAEEADQRADLQRGGVDRISLSHLRESFQRAADRPLVEWMQDILERWVLGQHLRVATLRSDGRAQRLRFGFGEEGLEFYASQPSEPVLTADHLAAALSLMDNCGMIARDAATKTYAVTEKVWNQ
jgi:hypothetical protein